MPKWRCHEIDWGFPNNRWRLYPLRRAGPKIGFWGRNALLPKLQDPGQLGGEPDALVQSEVDGRGGGCPWICVWGAFWNPSSSTTSKTVKDIDLKVLPANLLHSELAPRLAQYASLPSSALQYSKVGRTQIWVLIIDLWIQRKILVILQAIDLKQALVRGEAEREELRKLNRMESDRLMER